MTLRMSGSGVRISHGVQTYYKLGGYGFNSHRCKFKGGMQVYVYYTSYNYMSTDCEMANCKISESDHYLIEYVKFQYSLVA